MLELPHTIVGAAIAVKVGNPALALPLALASHFVLDLVPHWNPHIYTELKKNGRVSGKSKAIILTDGVVSVLLGLYIASAMSSTPNGFIIILASSLLAVIPDVVEIPFYFFGWHPKFIEQYVQFERKLQFNCSPAVGILSQLAIVAVVLFWIFS